MIFIILYLGTKISFLFKPIGIFISTLFFPILIAGFLCFLLNPILDFLKKKGLKHNLAVSSLFIGIVALFVLGIGFIVPVIVGQINDLLVQAPIIIDQTVVAIDTFFKSDSFDWMITHQYVTMDQIKEFATNFLVGIPEKVSSSLSSLFSVAASVMIIIVTVPVLLFYMFKDGHKFPEAVAKFFPKRYREDSLNIINDMGNTISAFIQGQIIVATIVGTISLVGFVIIKLPFALVLALAVAITNIIPYVGPFLGAIPAVIVGLFISPFQAVLVIVVILIAQQLEGNVISPIILGKTLNTHPVTIVILLLVAGNLAGVLGMLLAVPVYAVAKVVVVNIVKLIKLHRAETK